MVVFYLRNSRNPDGKIVPITVSLTSEVVKRYPNLTRPDQTTDPLASGIAFPNLYDAEGDNQWLLIAQTPALDFSGDKIDPEIVNVVTTGTVHQEIESAMGRIAAQVDWGALLPDTSPPKLTEFQPPVTQTQDVPITSNVIARLVDSLPAAGINYDTVKMKINDFDVTDDVDFTGTPFDLTLVYRPRRILS